jgi:hypothetical protein
LEISQKIDAERRDQFRALVAKGLDLARRFVACQDRQRALIRELEVGDCITSLVVDGLCQGHVGPVGSSTFRVFCEQIARRSWRPVD